MYQIQSYYKPLTLLAWSVVMKEGIMDFLRLYLSCHSLSFFTVGSAATKNCKQIHFVSPKLITIHHDLYYPLCVRIRQFCEQLIRLWKGGKHRQHLNTKHWHSLCQCYHVYWYTWKLDLYWNRKMVLFTKLNVTGLIPHTLHHLEFNRNSIKSWKVVWGSFK